MIKNSLLQRIITALVLIPLVVAGVLLLPTFYLALIFGLLTLLGGMEWTRLSGIDSVPGKIGFLVLLIEWWVHHRGARWPNWGWLQRRNA